MSRPSLAAFALSAVLLCSCRRAPPAQPVEGPAEPEQIEAKVDAKVDAKGEAQAAAQVPPAVQGKKTSCPSWESLEPDALSPAPNSMQARVLHEIWDKVRLRHFDPTLNCLNWVVLRGTYLKKLEAIRPSTKDSGKDSGQDSGQAYALYNELLSKLEQSHLKAVPPAPLIRELKPNRGPAQPRIHWTWLNNKLYLRDARPGEFVPAKHLRNAEILRIDGVLVSKLFAAPAPDQALDPMERALRSEALLSCPERGSKGLELRPPKGPVRTVKLPCEIQAQDRLTLGKLRNIETDLRASYLDPRAKVGYLAFNVWMLPMLSKLRQALSLLQDKGMQSLILDLRGNRGGVASMTIPVARLLWPQGGSLGTIQLRSFRQELLVRPNPKAFSGQVLLLLDGQSASTSEIFALGLMAAKRVKVVAAGPSAGMALASIIEGLPDGGLLQYVIGSYQSPTSQVAEGRGVAPDRLVPYGPADLEARRDPVLDAALSMLGSKERTPFSRPQVNVLQP